MKKRDKMTAIGASGVLIVLAVTVLLYGVSPGGSKPLLADIGAWLSNADGSVTYWGATGDFSLGEAGRNAIDVYKVTFPPPPVNASCRTM